MGNAKFKVEDEVVLKNNANVVGNVKQVVSVLSNGNSLYLVRFFNGLKMVSENDLDYSIKFLSDLSNVDLMDLNVKIQVDDKINEIVKVLDLIKSNDSNIILNNACKLQRYLISTYKKMTKYVGASSNNLLNNELYNGLIIGDRSNLNNSLIFKEIMTKLDAVVYIVSMVDSKGNFHASNLLLLNDFYYYFDVTQDIEVYLDSNEEDDIVLKYAGVGRDNYEKQFKPIAILDFDVSSTKESFPSNIAEDDIDLSVINKQK